MPPEAIPREKVREDIRPKAGKESLQQPMLYVLLGASLVVVCMGLILLIVQSC